jgi:hypothetical protein
VARALYSKLLWEGQPTTTRQTSNPVPSGFVWDVRDIVVSVGGSPFQNGGGFAISDSAGIIIFNRPNGDCPGATTWHWEGRQILDSGDELELVPSSLGVSWRITGYELTAT